jgi:DNA-binding transcriptional LysR family regulator
MEAFDFPSLRHLRMFESVARLESLSRAAAEVNRSQPAITQALNKLEDSLGVNVIDRHHSGSYLTDCGRILLLRTRRLFAQFEQALKEPLIGATVSDKARLRSILGKITTNHTRCLIATADSGSIEPAAHNVHVSRASLNRSIRELEQIIGRRLTRHTAHGVTLTQPGAELARRLKLAWTEIEYAREEISAEQGSAKTRISIGAMPQCATLVLTSTINEFLRREPGAHVTVENGSYDALLENLRMGRSDFLFGVLRRPDWATDVSEEPLFSAPYAIMARKHHPLTRKSSLTLEDFADYDWVLPRPGTPRRVSFERMFQSTRRKPGSSVEMSALDMQIAMIETSDRITLMSGQETQRAAKSGSVVALNFRPQVARGCDGVATRTGWYPTAGKLLFLKILRERALLAGAALEPSKDKAAQRHILRRKPEAVA